MTQALAIRVNDPGRKRAAMALRGLGGDQKFAPLRAAMSLLALEVEKYMTPKALARATGIPEKVMAAKLNQQIRNGASNGRVKLVGNYVTNTPGCRATKLITVALVKMTKEIAAISADNAKREQHLSQNHSARRDSYSSLHRKIGRRMAKVQAAIEAASQRMRHHKELRGGGNA